MTETFTLLKLTDELNISFGFDGFSRIMLPVVLILFAMAIYYSTAYIRDKKHMIRYYCFLCLAGAALVLMSLSANLFTFYLNYELLTLMSAPLVMHEETKEALTAGFKYLIYSFGGAYLVLFGFFVLSKYLPSFDFVNGGQGVFASGVPGLATIAVFSMILGFGVKAGMWPFHSWLTSAHPVAVSPASAILSGIVTGAGAAGIVRLLYFTTGTEVLKGTVFQTVWSILTLATVLMGSLLAFFEPVLKRRLAYSTISQMSYILFGLSLFDDSAYHGAMLQFVSHAFAKCALFLIAGALIKVSGCVKVSDMKGIGKKHPLIMWCYIFAALSMVGIPPTGGFMAKWYLLLGAVASDNVFIRWAGPTVLLVSALLTAGYLFPLAMRGFLPGRDFEYKNRDAGLGHRYGIPIAVLTILAVFAGIVPGLFVK